AQNPLTDAIELKNMTTEEMDLGGWFLSDSSGNYRKYRFPESTKIASEGYMVLQAQDFDNTNNPACLVPFGLNSQGEDIYLVQADTDGALLRFVDHIQYGAAPVGTVFGRWPDGTGPVRWLNSATLGGTNALPVPGYSAWAAVTFDSGTPAASMEPAADPDGD